MPTYIALLRGINVGGKNLIAMAALRELCASIGLADARTLLQSGNLVFSTEQTTPGRLSEATVSKPPRGKKSADLARLPTEKPAELERFLEDATKRKFGHSIDYIVRTAVEWERVIAANPFPDAARDDPSHLLVVFLKSAAPPAGVKALQAAIRGPETLRADGKQLYVTYPAGIAGSKLTLALIEKHVGCSGTGRNWNTVVKLGELARKEQKP